MALAEIWRWLSTAGEHFSGAWTLQGDEKKVEHKATLMLRALPAKSLLGNIKQIVRGSALTVGWRAKNLKFSKDRLEFVLKPYPLEYRLREEARREEFRQAARKKREGTHPGRVHARTPAPSATNSRLPPCTSRPDED